MSSNIRDEFQKKMLNFYLNTNFTPKTDFLFVLKGQPYLGYVKRENICPKAAIFDFDGIFERPDALPLYKQVLYRLTEKVGKNTSDLDRIDQQIHSPEDVPYAEEKFTDFFHDLRFGDYIEVNEEIAVEFPRYSLVKGAKECISKIKNGMGYTPGAISGCSKPVLEKVCEGLGMLKECVYGTSFVFNDNGRLVRINFNLGFKKLEAKDSFLQRNVLTKNGCHFIFEDDIVLSAPLMKAGINPSIIIKEKQQKELPFDVSTCCPEAREDLLKIIPLMYRFEYGWVATQLGDLETTYELMKLNDELNRNMQKSLGELDFSEARDEIARIALKVLKIKEKYNLVPDRDYINDLIGNLIVSYDLSTTSTLIGKIYDFFKSYIPESHVNLELLNDLEKLTQLQ